LTAYVAAVGSEYQTAESIHPVRQVSAIPGMRPPRKVTLAALTRTHRAKPSLLGFDPHTPLTVEQFRQDLLLMNNIYSGKLVAERERFLFQGSNKIRAVSLLVVVDVWSVILSLVGHEGVDDPR